MTLTLALTTPSDYELSLAIKAVRETHPTANAKVVSTLVKTSHPSWTCNAKRVTLLTKKETGTQDKTKTITDTDGHGSRSRNNSNDDSASISTSEDPSSSSDQLVTIPLNDEGEASIYSPSLQGKRGALTDIDLDDDFVHISSADCQDSSSRIPAKTAKSSWGKWFY